MKDLLRINLTRYMGYWYTYFCLYIFNRYLTVFPIYLISGENPLLQVNMDYEEIFSQFSGSKGDLIPILQRIQGKYGYLSQSGIEQVSKFLKISENRIYGVATFYSQFRFTEPGRNTIRVCMGTACHVRGGHILTEAVERELSIKPGESTPDRRFEFQRVACLGCCALAPVIQINDDIYGQVSIKRLKKILDKYD